MIRNFVTNYNARTLTIYTLFVLIFLATSPAQGQLTLDVNARDDKPGPVDIVVDAKNDVGTIIASQTLHWTNDDNTWSIQSMSIPFDTYKLRFTYNNDTCNEGCPDNQDADRNAHIDFFTVDGSQREGENYDRTDGTDPNPTFRGCSPQSLDGRDIITCGNGGDWVEYDFDLGCCMLTGGTRLQDVPEAVCADNGGTWNAGICIPTVSEWGLIAMGLMVLTAGTIVVRRRYAAVA